MRYHHEIKTFDYITQDDLDRLTAFSFDIKANPPKEVAAFNERYNANRAQMGTPIGEGKEDHYSFFIIPLNTVDISNFPFIFDVFENIERRLMNIFIFDDGKFLQPHTDRVVRTFAANFPIHNCEQSKTSFFSAKNGNVLPNMVFDEEDIILETELTYKVNTLHAINVQEIHAVYNQNDRPRIILSANITNNPYYDDFTRVIRRDY